VAYGSNFFQAKNPTLQLRKLSRVVHDGFTPEEAEKVAL
jgi:fructose-bisphosphate aldolase/2-amino-3,7-dideoxy-D-threo-hept-6-ulosonate synthase